MVLHLNAQNRPKDQMADQWPTYPATPSESYDAQSIGDSCGEGALGSIEEACEKAFAESSG